ncbi:MAG: ABC transporter ATP-binding protein [Chloroflexi bacterium]|nr:ABC transporter ATP-binding protein [Chloroflexota bacterium]
MTLAKAKKRHPFIRLLNYAAVYRRRVALATLYSVLGKLFDIMPPVLIGMAVDIVVQRGDSLLGRLGVQDLSAQLLILGFITLIVWTLESVFGYIQRIYWRNLAQSTQHDLRVDAYNHVQHLEMAYFEDQSTGGLMSVLNDDINQLERFLDIGASDVVQILTTVLVIGGIFFFIAPSVAWMAAIPIPFIIWGSFRFQELLGPRYSAVREQVSMINHHLSNSLSGIATIKSFTAEDYEAERLRIESDEYVERNRRAIRLSSAFTPMIRMVIVCGFIAITVAGGQLALNGTLDIGAYSVLIFMTQRLLWPLTKLGETFDQYQRAMASTNRILDLLAIKSSVIDGHFHLPLSEVRGHMRLDEVKFAYSDGREIIRGLTLNVPTGDTVAIVGATGAGKSTVIKLLLRYYDVTAGAVTLDGYDLRDLKQVDLRSAIGLVSQDVFLFHGTVRENIAYGCNGSVPEASIVEAAIVAEAHEFICELPQGYDTIVGERGQKLSGGQRQRLSIARAVLKDPPILILDEATSSVDNETEAAIQRSLERIVVGRTTIVIAHRLSTVRNADMIYVLQHGQLLESGHHDDLLLLDGLYAALWRVQTGERVLAGAIH